MERWLFRKCCVGKSTGIETREKVVVNLGDNDRLIPRFVGYIRNVTNGVLTKIELEDSMWLLKQTMLNDSWYEETLGAFMSQVVGSAIKTQCDDSVAKIGSLRITNGTAKDVMVKLVIKVKRYSKGKASEEAFEFCDIVLPEYPWQTILAR